MEDVIEITGSGLRGVFQAAGVDYLENNFIFIVFSYLNLKIKLSPFGKM